ncbi:MAG TPA: hypothetical protein VFJ71_03715 [Candidatus Limnocylindrales bacterium]|nr:hypothetical protein [Candidatus Limnocylindrales bacterium]
MSITIRAVGQAAKRGARRRVPSAAVLLDEIGAWLPAASGDPIHELVPVRTADGAIEVALHPAARPMRIEANDAGSVVATAMTVPVGPGYHTFAVSLLDRLAEDIEIEWDKSGGAAASSDPTGAFASGNRADAERGHLGWLRAALIAIRDARRQGGAGLHLATPPGVRYTVDAAVVSVLGPRDDAWLERALGDPRTAADVWPWVADAMDARFHLARALVQMWLHVRWRPPIGPDETALVDDVLETLRRAYPLEPELGWPWAEWRELLALRGQPDPATLTLIDRAAPHIGDTAAGAIGYRRRPVTIVHEGWALELPGSFTGTRTDEEWTGGESGRTVTLAGTPTEMSAEQFLRQVATHLGHDAIEHEDGPIRGRARLTSDASSGVEVATVEGYTAIRGRGAAIRIEIDDPQDWKWALDTWRSLRPA